MPLLGREVWFKNPTKGQIILMQRMQLRAKRAMANAADEQTQNAIFTELAVMWLNIAESLFLNEADRAEAEEAMLEGKIDFEDLTPILTGGVKALPAQDDDADPPAPKRPGRKAPAKKAAKKTANPRRASR